MKTNKTVIILTTIIYYLFFLWVIKEWRKAVFNRRKAKAIKEAKKLFKETKPKFVHVVQHGSNFYVGTKEMFLRMKRFNSRKLRKEKLKFDYRSAIIYTAK